MTPIELFSCDPIIERKISAENVHLMYGSRVIFSYDKDDIEMRNLGIVSLKKLLQLSNIALARFFGVDDSLIGKVLKRFEQEGIYGLRDDSKNSIGNSRKATDEIRKFIVEQRRAGKKHADIAKEVESKYGVKLTETRVCTICKEERASFFEQEELEIPAIKAIEYQQPLLLAYQEGVLAPTLAPTEAEIKEIEIYNSREEFLDIKQNRQAGVYVLLALAGHFGLFGSYNRHIKETREAAKIAYSTTQILMTIMCIFGLRYRSIEEYKYADHEDLGDIIGNDKSPCEEEIREIVRIIAKQNKALYIFQDILKKNLELSPVVKNVFAIDGSFAEYTGQDPLPKGYNPRRHIAMKGRTDNYLMDLFGRPLFFSTQPLNDGLSRGMKDIILALGTNIKLISVPDPLKIVFDRGGYCFHFFDWLGKQYPQIYFVTYLKERKNARCFPEKYFKEYEYEYLGKTYKYKLHIHFIKRKTGKQYKVITLLDENRKQIPIITNDINSTDILSMMEPAEAVFYLKCRWGMIENPIKFMRENYHIQQIITYKKEEAPYELKERPSKARKEINKELAATKNAITKILADIALLSKSLSDKGDNRSYESSLKMEEELGNLRTKWQKLSELKKQIPAREIYNVNTENVISDIEKRTLINIIKTEIFIIEKYIQEIIWDVFDNKKDMFGFIHNIYERSGKIIRSSKGILVCIKPFSRESHNKAFKHLLGVLNSMELRDPVSNKRIHYALLV